MIKCIFILASLFLGQIVQAQSELQPSDVVGTWTANVEESRSQSMDMMFDGSTVTLNEDFTFQANVREEFHGTWSLESNA